MGLVCGFVIWVELVGCYCVRRWFGIWCFCFAAVCGRVGGGVACLRVVVWGCGLRFGMLFVECFVWFLIVLFMCAGILDDFVVIWLGAWFGLIWLVVACCLSCADAVGFGLDF